MDRHAWNNERQAWPPHLKLWRAATKVKIPPGATLQANKHCYVNAIRFVGDKT
jgi:hypothetical protein